MSDNSCADKDVCCHVGEKNAKTHQCNLICDLIVAMRFFSKSLGDDSPCSAPKKIHSSSAASGVRTMPRTHDLPVSNFRLKKSVITKSLLSCLGKRINRIPTAYFIGNRLGNNLCALAVFAKIKHLDMVGANSFQ